MIEYKCTKCGASGVQLWRDYQTCLENIELCCIDCAIKAGKKEGYDASSDSIGWRVPAVLTAEGDTFWGYSSVPEDRVAWWYGLPVALEMTLKLRAYSLLMLLSRKRIINVSHDKGIRAVEVTALHIDEGENIADRVCGILDALLAEKLIHIWGEGSEKEIRLDCQLRSGQELADWENHFLPK